jgi:uncharacterized protein YkwD
MARLRIRARLIAARAPIAAVALSLAPTLGLGDPVAMINALRMSGCGDVVGVGERLQRQRAADGVARELARGNRLQTAIESTGYDAVSATSFHIRGARDDAAIRRNLAARYCTSINDPRYREIGLFQDGDETWIVLAVREPRAPPLDPQAVALRALELVNAARAEARTCGSERYEPAPALALSPTLSGAAAAHAHDMAQRGVLDHRGWDGSASGDRITRAGYAWRASGENVAAGQRDADAAVAAWLASPGHCSTLMGPHFTEMGIAFALAPEQDPPIYWAQVFAAPL